MQPVDFFASERQYAEHLVPIWQQLAPAERGRFYASSLTADRLRAEGIEPTIALPRVGNTPVVVSAHSDYVRTGHRPVVYVEHGAGQRYNGDPASARHPGYSGGRQRDRTVLFLCNSEPVADANRAVYRAPAEVVGCPKLDRWHGATLSLRPHRGRAAPSTDDAVQLPVEAKGTVASGQGPGAPVVAFSFHWDCQVAPEARTALPHYAKALRGVVPELLAAGWRVLGHGHPKAWARLRAMWVELGAEPVEDFAQVLDQADLYVADNSSTIYEFASIGRPVLLLNAPWYRPDVEHGLRFWRESGLGMHVWSAADLLPAVESSLLYDAHAGVRAEVSARVYPLADGQAARRAADALRHHLGGREWKDTPMPDPFRGRRKVTLNESNRPFPSDRLAKLGATPDEVGRARAEWDTLTMDQQQQSAAMMNAQSDDELAAAIEADREDVSLDQLWAWATAQVAAGLYPTTDDALDDLDLLAGYLPEELTDLGPDQVPAGEAMQWAEDAAAAGLYDGDPEAAIVALRAWQLADPDTRLGDHLAALRDENGAPLAVPEPFTAAGTGVPMEGTEVALGEEATITGDGTGEVLPLVGVPAPPEPEPADGSGTEGGGEAPAEVTSDGAAVGAAADPDLYDGATVASVLAYVGAEGADNRARAAYALGQELARPEADQRKGVLNAVRTIVGDS